MGKQKKWTPAEDRKLTKLRGEGKTFKQIAKTMERSEPACQQRHVKNQRSVSETLTSQDVGEQVRYETPLTVTTQPKPAWWKRLLGIGG